MTGESDEKVLFREVQRVCQWWIWLVVIVLAAFAWWTFLSQIVGGAPVGTTPAPDTIVWILAILIGIALPTFTLAVNMTTIVESDAVVVRYFPIYRRTVNLREIRSCRARDYRPIRDFGGWGIRWGFRRGMAYTVSGSRGVELELTSGRKLLIGSRRPEELAAAITQKLAH